ncbi:SufD family Fe-S cluster assembly protein, partial [Flavobacteriales bacterium]|nr:SufD family Fe-S cluster assembly protein [Flavobacteriales bacterium]
YDHESEGEFNSLVIVDRGGVNANTVQKNNNILLSSQASINSNPQLEIFTDDVKCAHGSTTGQIDADAVFYLRSRGLSLSQSNGLLLRGFLSEVVELSEGFEIHEELVENLKKLIKV